ncbi:conserved hypothetical protein [Methanocella paludicola SANAE]|uniref:Uncharacterized protein n=1 Tax=Methanocella paludicola (strain DSM 17711 / JCM 13418 / NBRC 101707 / SANAE) TaxID=304371 RepID=D1YYN4_METPS|nr:hypothetical protein [Methanocella paludicola]BAI61556.1 conserved hypothetical protein [Methanocella paludicola SANAE]
MKKLDWQIRIGLILVVVSIVLYILHYLIFQNFHFLSEYTLFYFAFMPIEVIFVTLVLDQLLEFREVEDRMEKLNMVIGVFFSEEGTRLLKEFAASDPDIEQIRNDLVVGQKWTDRQFEDVKRRLNDHPHNIDINKVDLENLRNILISKREFSVRLLENPVLLEHESFTELLRSVFHLTEELEFRKDLKALPQSDLIHIDKDMERVYARLIGTWLDYMKYMKKRYPYLYSLSMRTNPFDVNASPIVTQ